MAFPDDLANHSEHIKQRLPHIRGEESTKHALVIPLLQVLGYDVFNPVEVRPEYAADFAIKKGAGQQEKIDYAVFLGDKPAILIECKAADAKLDGHDAQLARYFNATPSVRVAVLTNGVRFRVFGDLQQPNIMDPSPWLDVDLRAPKAAEIDALKRFRKIDFSGDEIMGLAEEMVYYNAMVTFVSTQLRDPSESFVRYVAGEISLATRITTKIVDRLVPILRKAIQAAILEHVAKSFAPPESELPAAVSSLPEPPPTSPVPAERAGVITTDDELQAYELISGWIREATPQAPIGYRDSRGYLTIFQVGPHSWFTRLNVQTAPFWATLRHLQVVEAQRLAPGVEISEEKHLGDCRIALPQGVSDLPKLRAAFIAAYTQEAARKATDGAVSS